MSETNEQVNAVEGSESTEQTAEPVSARKQLKGSLMAVQETQRLLRSGHFAGARAHKIVICIEFLQALESQIKSQMNAEK